MILLTLFSQFKNKWWEKREQSLKKEFAVKEIELLKDLSDREHEVKSEIERKKQLLREERESIERVAKENELYESLVHDRREELEKSNKELKDQIRLIEAKAKPDSVWVTAFTSGFNKAWDMMLPLMSDGFNKMKDKIKDDAIEDSIKAFNKNVDSAVAKKIESLEMSHVKSAGEINNKIKDLEERSKLTTDKAELTQLKNYINALNWILNDNQKN